MQWKEFACWDESARAWVEKGNVAITPYLISRIGRGESRYLHACDPAAFRDACAEIDGTTSDIPKRQGINLDGEFLMRAIVKCRNEDTDTATARRLKNPTGGDPWKSTCPDCSLPFDHVAEHSNGPFMFRTMAACRAGHRWAV